MSGRDLGRPAMFLAAPRPWLAHFDADPSFIPLRTTREPIFDACLVPIDGDILCAEATARLIQKWSETDHLGGTP